ncbi:MAG: type II toxin-antitoxin system RelB/DinJ family antitoxin [Oscillospiraceae bacterium]|nr:type II toxin-antitoxin system RelB/DinJ family antitoxin [Oscillospiraceae bacterium]
MAKTANLNIRIDPETKSSAEKLFASFGITLTDAVNMFLHKALMEGGLPFELKQPRYNEATEAAMREAGEILRGRVQAKTYPSARALFEELDAEDGREPC